MNSNKYLKIVKKYSKIIIYGAGIYGNRVYEVLHNSGMAEKVICFAITENGNTKCKEIPVKCIYDLKEEYKDTLFLLAVSEKNMKEIRQVIKKLRIKHVMDARKLYLDSFQQGELKKWLSNYQKKKYVKRETVNRNSQNELKAAHITYCITNNAGDTMLSQCARKFLGFKYWKIIGVVEPVTDIVIEEINNNDILVIGGGGLFLPDTNKNDISGWQWAVSEEQLNNIDIPIVIFSVGYNYFKGQDKSELFIRSINNIVAKASFVGLRNTGSVLAIREILREDLRSKVIYQPCTTTLISKLYNTNKIQNTKIIGFNVAFDREERRFGDRKEEILTQIAKAARIIEQRGYKIKYIAHSDEDLRFLKYLDWQKVTYSVVNLTDSLPQKIIACYEKIDLMIGMRGHAQMIPFGIGCRIISLSTHDKMRWFLEDIDATEWEVNLTKNIDRISDSITKLFVDINEKNNNNTDIKLKHAQERLWNISCQNYEAIKQSVALSKKGK